MPGIFKRGYLKRLRGEWGRRDDRTAVAGARERLATLKSEPVDLDEIAQELGIDTPPEEGTEP